VSDSSAQPTKRMVSRFVGNPNSTIGGMLKRGMTGGNQVQTQDDSQEEIIQKVEPVVEQPAEGQVLPQDNALDVLEEAVKEAEESTHEVEIPVEEKMETPLVSTNVESPQQQTANTDEAGTGLISQVVPQVVEQNTDTLNPANPVGSAGSKESIDSVSLDQVAIDAARGAQQVEVEPSPEIPPEVESYLQKVEDHADTAPKEIVIADGSDTQPNNHNYPSQPVVVLPITQDVEKEGAKKNPKFSIRWLVEWSRKIMKTFSGKVIYRLAEEDQK
jgi:hypothetical protein